MILAYPRFFGGAIVFWFRSRISEPATAGFCANLRYRLCLSALRPQLRFSNLKVPTRQHQIGEAEQRKELCGLLRQTAIAVETAELNLSYTRIVAPIDGVVAERTARVGAYT